ncbi:DUF4148 domain-containing protein [Paraburkholderia dipogonis]|uniref:DUF4148 domain-containing protein n=1 Tax=Paraburkholderia dipogonis TaxID=1211383 RepID=UPI0038BB1B6B
MKSLIKAVIISAALVAPVVSFAQTSAPKTRAEVRAELVELEQAGYNPAASNDATYPDEIQAALARVAQKRASVAAAKAGVTVASDTGGAVAGTSESGTGRSKPSNDGTKPIYFGQ